MRDRLIGLIIGSSEYICDSAALIERLADHLLANGVIVPPCKVGDTLWFIKWYDEGNLHKPISRKVIYVSFSFKDNDVVIHFRDGACDSHCIGECAFLTKEEAEKALAGRSAK